MKSRHGDIDYLQPDLSKRRSADTDQHTHTWSTEGSISHETLLPIYSSTFLHNNQMPVLMLLSGGVSGTS
jgi:hypothetical protein